MASYYNEIDPYAAQWLRNLIAAGHIASGDVDERSISDVRAGDLAGYIQCHFFAGIGVWSAALRDAGFPDNRPVWTGSCPCQPLSAAGKGLGTRDPRHLWPVWFELIRDRRPVLVLGEQVASNDGLAWLDIVSTDLENEGYPVWPVDLCAAGVGAPNIRQRLWWMAHPDGRHPSAEGLQRGREHGQQPEDGRALRVADTMYPERGPLNVYRENGRNGAHSGWEEACGNARTRGAICSLANAERERHAAIQSGGAGRIDSDGEDGWAWSGFELSHPNGLVGNANGRRRVQVGCDASCDDAADCRWPSGGGSGASTHGAGPVNGFWRDADWIACTDGKARPVESGTFPLAHGDKSRVGKLRAYGNAINREVAAAFIKAAIP